MKKKDKQIIILIIIIALFSFVGFRFSEKENSDAKANSNYVIIYLDDEVYKKVSLSEPQTVVIDHDGKHNEIEITNNSVYMHDANCDNHDCIKQGEATLDNIDTRIVGGWIVCLPNKVSIELVKGNNNEN